MPFFDLFGASRSFAASLTSCGKEKLAFATLLDSVKSMVKCGSSSLTLGLRVKVLELKGDYDDAQENEDKQVVSAEF